jgi:hypothetical protein
MKHTREKKIEMTKTIRMLAILLVQMVTLILGIAAPELLAFGGHHPSPEVNEFEDAECGFEVNVTDFDTGFYACVDAEGWRWLKIYRDWDLLYWTWATGSLGRLGITENCFESSEPEGIFQEILDMFPPGICRFKARQVDRNYLSSEAELTHDFACVAEGIVFESNGEVIDAEGEACVPPGQDLVISWNPVVKRLVDLKFDDNGEVVYNCEEIDGEEEEVDAEDDEDKFELEYQVFVETGEDVEDSQELMFDPFDEDTSVTIPAAFLKADTEYKFEILVIEESGNRTIREIEFETCEEEE